MRVMLSLWLAASALVIGGLCSVPYYLSADLKRMAGPWANRLGDPALSTYDRARYRAGQAWRVLLAGAFAAVCTSYLYLLGLHLEVIRPLAEWRP